MQRHIGKFPHFRSLSLIDLAQAIVDAHDQLKGATAFCGVRGKDRYAGIMPPPNRPEMPCAVLSRDANGIVTILYESPYIKGRKLRDLDSKGLVTWLGSNKGLTLSQQVCLGTEQYEGEFRRYAPLSLLKLTHLANDIITDTSGLVPLRDAGRISIHHPQYPGLGEDDTPRSYLGVTKSHLVRLTDDPDEAPMRVYDPFPFLLLWSEGNSSAIVQYKLNSIDPQTLSVLDGKGRS